jgi:hypothetical protein
MKDLAKDIVQTLFRFVRIISRLSSVSMMLPAPSRADFETGKLSSARGSGAWPDPLPAK